MNKYDQKNSKKNRAPKVFCDYSIFQGKIRLVGEEGGPKVIDRDEAIAEAKSRGMNLVQIAYNKEDYPKAVCKIIDYGRFLYEQKKKEKNAAKQARAATADIKEVCFSIRIDDGDFNTKVKHIKEFLEAGDKVKLTVRLLRRELRNADLAKDTMKKVLAELEGLAVLDSQPSANGTILSCIVRASK